MATNSKFNTMGTGYGANPLNLSGAASPSTKAVKRGSTASAGQTGSKANRKPALERNGFKGAPQTTIAYPNAPEAKNEFRQVKLVPSSVGNRDFYNARQNPTEGAPFASPGFPGGSWTPPTKP